MNHETVGEINQADVDEFANTWGFVTVDQARIIGVPEEEIVSELATNVGGQPAATTTEEK